MSTSYPKEKIRILLLENISQTAVARFNQAGYSVRSLPQALSENELIREIAGVHLLGIRSKTEITAAVLHAATKLQAIGCFCIGTSQVDLRAAAERGVCVFNAPFSNTRSVAELVIGASILLIRRVLPKHTSAHRGIWHKASDGSRELRGKTMGIVGYGNIGSQVSVLAEALGMRVIYYDTEIKLPLGNASARPSLQAVAEEADVLTLHIPDTPQTRNMIGSGVLHSCRKGTVVINFARGGVVDLEALKHAIESGHIGGAAVDVFPEEPEKNGDLFTTPLAGLDNVLLTPHIGGSTEEAQEHIGEDVSQKLLQYLELGATTGSHTLPALSLPPVAGAHRILHIHRNVPGVLSEINARLSEHQINILSQYLKTNEHIGYVVLDIDRQISAEAQKLLSRVKETIKTRMLY